MRSLLGDNVICIDVDDTLVSWARLEDLPEETHVLQTVEVELEDEKAIYQVFPENVASLKTHHQKGHTIVVWSGSGVDWARAVVKALKLEDHVDLVMCKPRWLLDDMAPAEFMPTSYWGAGDPGKVKLK